MEVPDPANRPEAMTPDNRLNLFEKVVVGELTEAERASLAELLRDSREGRAEFRQYVSLHVD